MLPTTKYKKNPHPHANYMATLIGRLQTSLNDSRSFVHTVTPKTCTITCVRHVSIGCWDYEHLIPLYSRKIKCIGPGGTCKNMIIEGVRLKTMTTTQHH